MIAYKSLLMLQNLIGTAFSLQPIPSQNGKVLFWADECFAF